MKKWRAITGIILVFLLGAASGALVTYKLHQQRMESGFREPGRMKEFIIGRLSRDLNLDPAQMKQLQAIVEETHLEIRDIRRKCRPQTEEVLARSQDRIRAILRPDQLEKYEKIVADHKMRRMRHDDS